MRRRRAAAAAHQIDPVLGDEALQPHRHFLRRQRVFGLAVDQFRQAGIGLHRNQAFPVLRQEADMLRHFLRTGGAVEAHQRYVQRIDHRRRRRDIRPDQQRAGGLDRDLDEDRSVCPGFGAGRSWRR